MPVPVGEAETKEGEGINTKVGMEVHERKEAEMSLASLFG